MSGEGHFVAEDCGDVEVDGGGEGKDVVENIGYLVGDGLALMRVLEEFFYLGGGDFIIALNAELIRFQAGGVSEGELHKAVDLIRTCSADQNEAQIEEPFMPTRNPVRAQPNRQVEEPTPLRRQWSGD